MSLITEGFQYLLHLNEHLAELINYFGVTSYVILFCVIFCETAFVVTPFLPGDSLLFAAGAVVSVTDANINVHLLVMLLIIAAFAGDAINYWIGRFVGEHCFSENARFLKQRYLKQTHDFFEKYGGKTIIIARFVPIVRTFAPFVAGASYMRYYTFMIYNLTGGILWITSITYAGYFFGTLPIVRDHFSLVIIFIIILSITPGIFEYIKAQKIKRKNNKL